jgi:hypothetical protein
VIVALLLIGAAQSIAEAQEEGAKVLKNLIGSWSYEVTDNPSQASPDGGKRRGRGSTSWTLKERYILNRDLDQSGDKSLSLTTYDPDSMAFSFTYFNSKGVLGAEWAGTWDAGIKTLTYEATSTPEGWTSLASNHFPDDKSNELVFWMKDASGTAMFDAKGKKSRQPDDAAAKTLAAWSKTGKHDAPVSPEMKILGRLVGTWDVVAVAQPAEWTPKKVTTTSKVTRTWVLDRNFVQDTSKSSDGHEGMSLFTYDPKREKFLGWWFSSEGYTTKSTGEWDAVAETFSFELDIGEGLLSKSAARFIDEDHQDWRVVTTDADGKLYFDKKWSLTRSKP